MDVDVELMSRDERSEYIASLIEQRCRAQVPDTLKIQAFHSIIKNHSHFVGRSENPFQNLPNSIVQQFLSILDKAKEIDNVPLIPENEEGPFVLQLLNPSIKSHSWQSSWNEVEFFKHLAENCPHVSNISFFDMDQRDWKGVEKLFGKYYCQETFFWKMSSSWKNLTSLRLNCNFYCKDDTFRLINKYLPHLEHITFAMDDELTIKSANNLSCLQNLRDMEIVLYSKFNWVNPILAHIAGKVPQLQTLNVSEIPDYQILQFVQQYGKLYPRKQLRLKMALRLDDILETEWPLCLSIDKLTIEGPMTSIENMSTITCAVKKVTLEECSPSIIYSLVEKLGPSLTDLRISNYCENTCGPLNLYRVLAACPNIEQFRILYSGPYEKNATYNLTPQHFKNCFLFSTFYPYHGTKKDEEEFLKIYKMFLLGSKRYLEKLSIGTESEMKVVMWALRQDHCTCLSKLKKVYLNAKKDSIESVKKAYEVAAFLISCCLHLKKVEMSPGPLFRHSWNEVAINVEKSFQYLWLLQLIQTFGIEFSYSSSYYDQHVHFFLEEN